MSVRGARSRGRCRWCNSRNAVPAAFSSRASIASRIEKRDRARPRRTKETVLSWYRVFFWFFDTILRVHGQTWTWTRRHSRGKPARQPTDGFDIRPEVAHICFRRRRCGGAAAQSARGPNYVDRGAVWRSDVRYVDECYHDHRRGDILRLRCAVGDGDETRQRLKSVYFL